MVYRVWGRGRGVEGEYVTVPCLGGVYGAFGGGEAVDEALALGFELGELVSCQGACAREGGGASVLVACTWRGTALFTDPARRASGELHPSSHAAHSIF